VRRAEARGLWLKRAYHTSTVNIPLNPVFNEVGKWQTPVVLSLYLTLALKRNHV